MFKNKFNIAYLIVVICLFIGFAIIYSKAPKTIDWNPSFEKTKETPFGTKYVYQNLNQLFNKGKIISVNKSLYETIDKNKSAHANYIFIGRQFNIDNLDMWTMLSYVSNGNDVFIAAEEMNSVLQDTLGFYLDVDMNVPRLDQHNVNTKSIKTHYLKNPSFGKNNAYPFKNMVFPTSIMLLDTLAFKVLAVDNENKPVFVCRPYGNGHIYIHSYPYAFSNYYLLYKNKYEYISKCLSVLPNIDTYWDEYYKKEHTVNEQSTSPIHFILNSPSLHWAWNISILSLVLYVLFRMKRQQRIIPIIKPFENSSLQFIQTVGRLYFNKGDHSDLIKKQITYWLEYIRSKFFISTTKLDKSFITSVSDKSGIPISKIEEIIYLISEMKNKNPSKKEVIYFYKKLEYFYKNTKR